jgi:hypothetical protein
MEEETQTPRQISSVIWTVSYLADAAEENGPLTVKFLTDLEEKLMKMLADSLTK